MYFANTVYSANAGPSSRHALAQITSHFPRNDAACSVKCRLTHSDDGFKWSDLPLCKVKYKSI